MLQAREITAEQVRLYRERTGASMQEAKRILQAWADIEFLGFLRAASIEDKVNWLIDQKIQEAERICKTADGRVW